MNSTCSLPLSNIVILDIETKGLDARFDPTTPVYCVCTLTVDERGVTQDKFFSVGLALDYLHTVVDQGYILVAHNMKFDYGVLRTRGLAPCEALLDTMVMAYLQNSGLSSYSLDFLTGEKSNVIQAFVDQGFFGEEPPTLAQFWQQDWSDDPRALELIAEYCCDDLRATLGLYNKLAEWFNRFPKYIKPLLDVEMPMIEVLAHMERVGAYISGEHWDNLRYDLSREEDEARAILNEQFPCLPKLQWKGEDYEPVVKEFKATAKSPDFPVKKHKSYVAHYMDNNGIVTASDPYSLGNHCPLLPYNANAATGHTYWVLQQTCPDLLELSESTKTGKAKLDKDYFSKVADALPDNLPIAKLIKAEKYLSTLEGLQKNVAKDGRIHCNFANTRTITGRLATQRPNLQNIARPDGSEKDYGRRFRELLRPQADDGVMLVADLDRIEIVVLAWFLWKVCGDRSLLDLVNSGADVHQANADKWGVSRTIAKTLIFLLVYGGTPKLIFKRGMSKTLKEAESMFAGVHKGQPSIQELKEKVWTKVRKQGYINNPFGGRGVYTNVNSSNKWERLKAERQSFNWLIQKTARDVLHLLAIESLPIVESHYSKLILLIHDEAIVESHRGVAGTLCDNLNTVWNNRTDILEGAKINGEWAVGDSWYTAKG